MRDRKGGFGPTPGANTEACPVEYTLNVIGGKWKGIILYHLIKSPKRFNEFRRICPSITQRVLTLQLRELEEDGVISRTVYPEIPPKVEYALSDFGRTLIPIIMLMKEWGQVYMSNGAAQHANDSANLHDL
ncbi:helix-turn-helix domain-containing protein [Paenibacillus filicis]|uniref:Helix-turn-helix domain-containing protein n=1 Tax=Paenibacillus filicis TaxID=669464 RepID=A0ABU9DJV4_9BACL